jgi:hypothetical protein
MSKVQLSRKPLLTACIRLRRLINPRFCGAATDHPSGGRSEGSRRCLIAVKILVTGAAGFIGMTTSLRLLARGDEVVGLDNLNDYYDVSLKEDRLARG